MLSFPPTVQVYIAQEPIDMRNYVEYRIMLSTFF
jgi:intein-encoded DNA endonuclease-like protein